MKRFHTISFRVGILAAGAVFLSCVHENPESPPPTGTKTAYGSIVVSFNDDFSPYWKAATNVSADLYDGEAPSPVEWQQQAAIGACYVAKPVAPFCDPGCGSGSLCTTGGVCRAFPSRLNAGVLTVTGVKTASGASSLVMSPSLTGYRPTGITLADTPFAEGETLTITAGGGPDVPTFSVTGRGHAPPRLLNDSIILDGKSILLRWTPPGPEAGPSEFQAHIDISHHGGIKGTLVCVGEDDGELEIPGPLVNHLKALGISGFPQIDLIRRAVVPVIDHHVVLSVEARTLRYVTIPGLVSCREDDECPGGQTCQADFRCQ